MSDADQTQEDPDDRVQTIEITCTFCKAAIHSPIRFHQRDQFDTATLIGNRLPCSCGKVTACNKENMRIVYVDESGGPLGYVGQDVRK